MQFLFLILVGTYINIENSFKRKFFQTYVPLGLLTLFFSSKILQLQEQRILHFCLFQMLEFVVVHLLNLGLLWLVHDCEWQIIVQSTVCNITLKPYNAMETRNGMVVSFQILCWCCALFSLFRQDHSNGHALSN